MARFDSLGRLTDPLIYDSMQDALGISDQHMEMLEDIETWVEQEKEVDEQVGESVSVCLAERNWVQSSSSFPESFGEWFQVPIESIARYVRNASECAILMDIGRLGGLLDKGLGQMEEACIEFERAARNHQRFIEEDRAFITGTAPIVGMLTRYSHHCIVQGGECIEQIVSELQQLAPSIEKFAQLNSSVACELDIEGVHQAASEKRTMARLERVVIERIHFLVGVPGALVGVKRKSEGVCQQTSLKERKVYCTDD